MSIFSVSVNCKNINLLNFISIYICRLDFTVENNFHFLSLPNKLFFNKEHFSFNFKNLNSLNEITY